MVVDRFCRIVGQIGFLCAVGAIMTLVSIAALNAASMSGGPLCGMDGCVTLAAR